MAEIVNKNIAEICVNLNGFHQNFVEIIGAKKKEADALSFLVPRYKSMTEKWVNWLSQEMQNFQAILVRSLNDFSRILKQFLKILAKKFPL